MAPRVGLEPTTTRLTAGCSTIELPRSEKDSGNQLLSHRVTPAVPSPLEGLTHGFEMLPGVAPPLLSPETYLVFTPSKLHNGKLKVKPSTY